MIIDRNNYESFFLDYLDGSLPAGLLPQLKIFLDNNPDLASELEELQNDGMMSLTPETTVFIGRESLKKTDRSDSRMIRDYFDETCIAFLEGDLNAEEKTEFDQLLKNDPSKMIIFRQFEKLRFSPDLNIHYPDVSSLKKFPVRQITTRKLIPYFAVAASLLLLVTLWFILREQSGNQKEITSSVKHTPDSSVNSESQPIMNNGKTTLLSEISIKKKSHSGSKRTEHIPANIIAIKYDVLSANRSTENDPGSALMPAYREVSSMNSDLLSVVPVNEILTTSAANKKETEYPTPGKLISGLIKKKLLRKEEDEKLDIWTIAGEGVRQFGKLTGTGMVLTKHCSDPDCKVVTYALNTKGFEISTQKSK
ncbi:MAG: hypothetical protein NTW49_10650 [Bacteroidia bacterium]|nr:hypothetical protein [Bacteroidia bacterium]